ncbi:hypothetical protein [Nocardia jiangsuensis]|uniref:YbaB/EbfC DNA-binding family protein n=1 Tax=Nocardia jiangsuensis TaxID=1691563 RepID=A0ABV8DWZ9_9NOCA
MSDAEQVLPAEWSAVSHSGAIVVRTTEQGLPIGLTVEAAELKRNPAELAAEIMRLCRRSADHAGLARRAQLQQAGLAPEMLALTGLPTPEEVARREQAEEEEFDMEPRSWLRPV